MTGLDVTAKVVGLSDFSDFILGKSLKNTAIVLHYPYPRIVNQNQNQMTLT